MLTKIMGTMPIVFGDMEVTNCPRKKKKENNDHLQSIFS